MIFIDCFDRSVNSVLYDFHPFCRMSYVYQISFYLIKFISLLVLMNNICKVLTKKGYRKWYKFLLIYTLFLLVSLSLKKLKILFLNTN